MFPVDAGLAAALLGVTPETVKPGSDLAGPMLECFVVGELRRQLGWSRQRATMQHYRDSRGREVDIVLEAPDGCVVAIEVKAGSTVRGTDTAGLNLLRDRVGERFVAGFVVHTGSSAAAIGERLTAVPLDALWTR